MAAGAAGGVAAAWGGGAAACGISIWPRSRVTLDSVTFESNHADNSSGAIANCGLLTLNGPNKFMDNTAKNGGAIYNYVYNNESGQITINGTTTFIYNKAEDKGGVIYNDYDGDITITGAIFSYNWANYGSAIYNEGTIEDTGSTFSGNRARYGTFYNCYDADNDYVGHAVMAGSKFMQNTAGCGGAIYDEGTSTLNNCDITDNQASSLGGGIFSNGSKVTINGGRIDRNHAEYGGGGIYNRYGTVNRGGYILAGNSPDDRFDEPII